MKEQHDLLDEAIKIIFLNSNEFDNVSSKALLNKTNQFKIPDEQRNKMLMLLKRKHLSSPTIGEIITKEIETKGWSVDYLAKNVKVPLKLLKGLASDEVLSNVIPVGFMKNILSTLQIPINDATEAIWQAFYQIKSLPNNKTYNSLKPAHRKGRKRQGNDNSSYTRTSNRNALFESEDALQKYLEHLQKITN